MQGRNILKVFEISLHDLAKIFFLLQLDLPPYWIYLCNCKTCTTGIILDNW